MTAYNESIGYDAVIPYNGATTPPMPIPASGFGTRYLYPIPRRVEEDDEAIVALLLELLDD